MSKYDELRRLAEAATPGPWGAPNPDWPERAAPILSNEAATVALAWRNDFGQRKADATYIAAASPDVILALLDERERLREAAEMVCVIVEGGGPDDSEHERRHHKVGWFWYSGRRQFSCDCGATF